jgi:hypothetical protein
MLEAGNVFASKGTHVRQFLLAAASFAALIPPASASPPPASAVAVNLVLEYLEALKRIGVVE